MSGHLSVDEETLSRRAQAREAVLGPSSFTVSPSVLSQPLLEWSESAVWDVWSHPDLSINHRCLVTITILAIQGRMEQLELHVRGAFNNGWSSEQLAQWVNHLAVYGGVAAAAAALGVVQKISGEGKG
ncbi:4-carboxymuconolactone decarboxylase [Pseudomonas sp. JAI111]|uniref:carboxymuconolactone decarboxylase family protein n=1 Tax=Pseudomonas sp. JAI111 TaxID=2735913 RepID=UPI00216AA326|nr:carboxymuconolactone decarboxylase family protein [Pseudomonas sp. JAI111]MCS3835699.1 4-carboxymuconolactone decarboxylase [Pseudomonas sp. JAI111]